ncbi:MAG TPA: aldo/keto reductase [Microscillaceae bacterium]|nr:aldo/keto reductase [Microscillaceae bacterium]
MKTKYKPPQHSRRKALQLVLGSSTALLTFGCGISTADQSNAVNAPSILDNLQVDANQLIQRVIPSSGEKLPVVGLGTWQTFDVGNDRQARKRLIEVLTVLQKMGGKMIDSSPMYGSSEKVVGDLCQQLGLRKELFMATKVWTSGQQAGKQQMNQSIQKMQAKSMDLMQVHNLVDVDTHLKTLRAWKAQGKIRYLGVTHYTTGAYPQLMRLIKSESLDFVQFNYNMKVREAEKRLLPLAKEKGVAVIINRPYAGGSLFRVTRGKPLPEWTKEYDINSWGQYFLKYMLGHPAVNCVIPGTSKPKHMRDNMGAAYGKLPDEKGRKKMLTYLESL